MKKILKVLPKILAILTLIGFSGLAIYKINTLKDEVYQSERKVEELTNEVNIREDYIDTLKEDNSNLVEYNKQLEAEKEDLKQQLEAKLEAKRKAQILAQQKQRATIKATPQPQVEVVKEPIDICRGYVSHLSSQISPESQELFAQALTKISNCDYQRQHEPVGYGLCMLNTVSNRAVELMVQFGGENWKEDPIAQVKGCYNMMRLKMGKSERAFTALLNGLPRTAIDAWGMW